MLGIIRTYTNGSIRIEMSQSKVALVTGSGKRRVGWHIADALASRGYDLVLHYRTSAAEAADGVSYFKSRGVDAVGLQADLSDEKAATHPRRNQITQTIAVHHDAPVFVEGDGFRVEPLEGVAYL